MNGRKRGFVADEQLDVLERQLAGTLRPLSPPQGLVQRLRQRIHIPDRTEIAERLQDWQKLFIIVRGPPRSRKNRAGQAIPRPRPGPAVSRCRALTGSCRPYKILNVRPSWVAPSSSG